MRKVARQVKEVYPRRGRHGPLEVTHWVSMDGGKEEWAEEVLAAYSDELHADDVAWAQAENAARCAATDLPQGMGDTDYSRTVQHHSV